MEHQTLDTDLGFTSTSSETQRGADAPKGARAVFSRIIKEGANVPLFLGQTMINALRDLGYNHTTSAICEHVDNSLTIKDVEPGRERHSLSGLRCERVVSTFHGHAV